MAFSIATAFVDIKPKLDKSAIQASVNETASSFGSAAQRMGGKASALGGSLTKGLTLPIVGAVTALGGLAVNAASTADAVVKSARAAGISTDAYQELEYALGQAGMSQATMDKILKRNNQRLGEAADGTGKYAEAYKALGVETHDANGNLRSSEDVMNDVIRAVASIEDPALRSSMAAELLGKNAGADLAVALDGGADAIDGARARAHELGVVMGEDALAGSEAFMDGLDDLKRSFGGMVVQIGSAVMPMLQSLLPIIVDNLVPAFQRFAAFAAGLVEKFTQLSPRTQSIIVGIVGLVAAIGPALLVVGKLLTIGGSMIGVLTKLGTAFKIVGVAFKALTAILAANPFLLVIAAVVALVVIIVKNWDTIKKYLAAAWNWIKKTASAVWQAITGHIKEKVNQTKREVIAVWNAIKSFFSTTLNAIKNTVSRIWNSIKSAIANAINGAKSNVTNAVNNIKSAVGNAFNAAKTLASNAFNSMKARVVSTINSLLGIVRGLPGRIRSGLGNLGNLLRSAGMNLIRGLMNGITAMAGRVASAAKRVVQGAIDGAKRLLRLGSPSRLFHQFGEWTGEGLAIGLEDQRKNVRKSAQKMMDFGSVPSLRPEVAMAGAGAATARGRHSAGGVSIGNLNINVDGKFDFNDPLEQRRFAERIREHIMRLEGEYA